MKGNPDREVRRIQWGTTPVSRSGKEPVGRIITHVSVENAIDPSKQMRFDALVDTGAYGLTLPMAWKDRLGALDDLEPIRIEMADQRIAYAEIGGPVKIQLEGFRRVSGEVIFVDMEPESGEFEPLVGYIVLEQSAAAVDVLGHRLIELSHYDLKAAI